MKKPTDFSLMNFIPLVFMGLCVILTAAFILINDITVDTISSFIVENRSKAVAILLAIFALKGVCAIIWYSGLVAAGGFALGFWTGLTVNVVGTVICLTISYIIGYFTKENPIHSVTSKNKRLAKYIDKCEKNSFFVSYLLHALGISTEALGVVFGFMKMPYIKYIFSSLLAMLPGMICITFLGNEPSITSPAFWIDIGIKLIVMAIAYFADRLSEDNIGKQYK